jgi:Spy/CpxP family protein refolding chaperone
MNTLSKKIAALLVLSLFGLVSCDKIDGGNGPEDGETDEPIIFTSISEFDEIDVSGSLSEKLDATHVYGYEEKLEGSERAMKGKRGPKRGPKKGAKKHDQRGVMGKLDLSDEQKEQIKTFADARKECASGYFELLREVTSSVLEQFEGQREAIVAEYQAGNITKEEAGDQLEALKNEVKAALEGSAERTALIEELKACQETYRENVMSILSEEQLAIWEDHCNKEDDDDEDDDDDDDDDDNEPV